MNYTDSCMAAIFHPFAFISSNQVKAELILGIHVLPFRVPHQIPGDITRSKDQLRGETDSLLGRLRLDRSFSIACSWSGPLPLRVLVLRTGKRQPLKLQDPAGKTQRLECKKLVLTHLGEEMLQRRKELQATCAEDGMVIEL